MPLTSVDKVKINKYLKERPQDRIYYLELLDLLGKRGKLKETDFIYYFTDYIVAEFQKDEKISINHISKVIFFLNALLYSCNQESIKLNEESVEKLRYLKDFYNEYINKNNFEIDESFYKDYIDVTVENINEWYPSSKSNDNLAQYINKIAELEKQVKTLTNQLEEINKLYSQMEEEYKENKEKLDDLNTDKQRIRDELKERKKELKKMSDLTTSLNDRILELESELSIERQANIDLAEYKLKYDKVSKELTKLKQKIEKETLEKEKQNNIEIKRNQLEELIYQKLLFDKSDINELLTSVTEQGIITDKNEVLMVLKNLKRKINIEINNFSLNPVYNVAAPKVLESGQFLINIPNGCKYYDIMLISDFHIREFDNKVLSAFDKLNNYCVMNGINLILNLGDFYHGTGNKGHKQINYDNAIDTYKLIEKSATLIPKVDGLYHAILGGNHERVLLSYGYDPIKTLASERDDIIELGYTHSTIMFANKSKTCGKFDVHHPDTFDFAIDLNEFGIDTTNVNKYLNNVYAKQFRSRNDSYIDIFGHMHKSQINYYDAYCYIPSLLERAGQKGACHLRTYFDDNNEIKYMVLMPLTLGDNLVKNNEIVYQKTISK